MIKDIGLKFNETIPYNVYTSILCPCILVIIPDPYTECLFAHEKSPPNAIYVPAFEALENASPYLFFHEFENISTK